MLPSDRLPAALRGLRRGRREQGRAGGFEQLPGSPFRTRHLYACVSCHGPATGAASRPGRLARLACPAAWLMASCGRAHWGGALCGP
jgi:hypothetical protein